MNKALLQHLCETFSLGSPLSPAEAIPGFYQHQLWQIKTSKGQYVIKQCSENNFWQALVPNDFINAEEIVAQFLKQDIPAVLAIHHGHSFVEQCEGKTYLVYPYIHGNKCSYQELSHDEVFLLGQILAKIHQTDLIAPQFDRIYDFDLSKDLWQSLSACPLIQSHQSELSHWTDLYHSAKPSRQKHLVLSHCDINPSNVLWHHGKPHIIDWESIARIDPALDLFNLALNFSGIVDEEIDSDYFIAIIQGYRDAGSEFALNESVCHASLGSWLAWLAYLAARSLKEPSKIIDLDMQASLSAMSLITAHAKYFPDLI